MSSVMKAVLSAMDVPRIARGIKQCGCLEQAPFCSFKENNYMASHTFGCLLGYEHRCCPCVIWTVVSPVLWSQPLICSLLFEPFWRTSFYQ